ncbi:PocR ligand-binding domain-containing protein [Eubacterium barkeri]|uniref:Ligand-binding sensor domain-containing protein n=1 Tax=Eubacterium barkeri TaxID=1528 RepID=A0A1H3I7E6_EUBBA|nr:PocR ligand-binding domain-containing protein [Eubacterium barkeri]SDY23581.1 Ligand-binding sensor domain-containing protein [Eubacterium barkeri]
MPHFIMNLAEIVNIDELEKILNAYTKATKMSSLITDYRGNPISTERYFHPICLAIREDPKRRQRCIKCDALGGLEASIKGEPCIYKCHAGLVEVCAPIIIDDQPVANLFTGQMLLQAEDSAKIDYLCEERTDILADPILGPIYTRHLETAPRMSYEQIRSYSTFIIEIANYIAKISYEKILQKRLQEQEKKLLESKNVKLKSKLMVNQYNALFLTEAFNTIYNQAILENAVNTAELLFSFSTMFKRNISMDTHYISMAQEIEDILGLVDLFNTTFDQQVELLLDIPRKLDHELVPITGFQPIVSNVFLSCLSQSNTPIQLNMGIIKEQDLLKARIFCSYVQFPDINFKSEEALFQQELFFSKASFFTLKLVADHLSDFYPTGFKMYTESNCFYFEFPSVLKS